MAAPPPVAATIKGMPGSSNLAVSVALSAAGAVATVLAHVAWPAIAVVGVLGIQLAAASRGARVTLGDDGVGLRGVVRRRFIPYARIARVRSTQTLSQSRVEGRPAEGYLHHQLRLDLVGGKTVVLETSTTRFDGSVGSWTIGDVLTLGVADPVGDALAGELRRRIAELGARRSKLVLPVDRGELPVAEWIETLRRHVHGEAGLREADAPLAAWWEVVDDPTVDAVTRAAVAWVLRPGEGDRDAWEARVQALRARSVCPDLERALSPVIDAAADDASVVAALAQLAPRAARR